MGICMSWTSCSNFYPGDQPKIGQANLYGILMSLFELEPLIMDWFMLIGHTWDQICGSHNEIISFELLKFEWLTCVFFPFQLHLSIFWAKCVHWWPCPFVLVLMFILNVLFDLSLAFCKQQIEASWNYQTFLCYCFAFTEGSVML